MYTLHWCDVCLIVMWSTLVSVAMNIWQWGDQYLSLMFTFDSEVIYIWQSGDVHFSVLQCRLDSDMIYTWQWCDLHLTVSWCTLDSDVMYNWQWGDVLLSQYRGITLASAIYKIYAGIPNKRLTTWSEHHQKISDEQNGFRHGRSCAHYLSTLTPIIDSRKRL